MYILNQNVRNSAPSLPSAETWHGSETISTATASDRRSAQHFCFIQVWINASQIGQPGDPSGVQGTESLVFVLFLFSNVFGKCFLAAKLTRELGHKKSHLLFPPLPAQQIVFTALEWSSL